MRYRPGRSGRLAVMPMSAVPTGSSGWLELPEGIDHQGDGVTMTVEGVDGAGRRRVGNHEVGDCFVGHPVHIRGEWAGGAGRRIHRQIAGDAVATVKFPATAV